MRATCTVRTRPQSATWCRGPRPRTRRRGGAWGATLWRPRGPAPPRGRPHPAPLSALPPPPGGRGAAQTREASAAARQGGWRTDFARSPAVRAPGRESCALRPRARSLRLHRSPAPPPLPPPSRLAAARRLPHEGSGCPPPVQRSTRPLAPPPAAEARAGNRRCTAPPPPRAVLTAVGSESGSLRRRQPPSSPAGTPCARE